MIDISDKPYSLRIAIASGEIVLESSTIEAIRLRKIKKGDVIEVAKVAGIEGSKMTFMEIPYCHHIPIEYSNVEILLDKNSVKVKCEVKANYKTGVEMEALSCVTRALLTIWDMVKYLEKDEQGQYPHTSIQNIKVETKLKVVENQTD